MTERLRGGSLGAALVDVTVAHGVVVSVDPADTAPVPVGATVTNLGRGIVMPTFVNGHAHLDKTFWGLPWRAHRPGESVRQRVAHERAIRSAETSPQLPRSIALAREMARAGVGTVRTHVDIDTLVGLGGLETILEVREQLRGEIEIQIVAFPQSGILADPGVADLMAAAIASGADVVGGLDPQGFDGDVAGHLDVVFGLAEHTGAAIDIHLHDPGHIGLEQIREICIRTVGLGMQGRVAISHAYALGSVPLDEMLPAAEALAEAKVSIMTTGPVGTTPPVKVLRATGVNVFTGSDGIRDAWTPYGEAGMTAVARQLAFQLNAYDDVDLEAVADIATIGGAIALGLDNYGVLVGGRADLIAFEATAVAEVVATSAHPALVFRAGQRV